MQIVMEFRFITYLLINSSMVMYILISLVRNGLWKAFRASGIHLAKRALRYGKMRIRGKYEGKIGGPCKVNMLVASEILHFSIIA